MKRGSSSTNSRSSSDTRRYHMRAPTSQVDESLFGRSTQISASKAKNQSQKNQEGETVQIITNNLIRNLRIPFKDPSRESIILPSAEFERITSTSRVLTKKQKEALREAHQRKKEVDIRAAEERKCQIYEADMSRKDNQALTELEREAQDRAKSLVEKASVSKMEQEQEIKQLNTLILGAQCQATRDAQIREKKQIQAELLEEEKRLDGMMEVERSKALEAVELNNELRRQERIGELQKIQNQIQQHLEERQVEDVMKEKEKQQIRKNLEKMNLEDLKALEKKREERKRLQEEIVRINNETVRAKERRREEERLADMRDVEYRRNKMKQQAEYEAEQRWIKKEKELEITKLRAQQRKAKNYKAEQDELRARRNQEVIEREWRRKEKELTEKKVQQAEMLRTARLEQVRCKEHLLAMEADREKAEFERVLKVQQEALIKQEEAEEKQRQKAHRYSETIRNQVKAHELSAAAQRREVFKEADRLMEEARQRRVRLDEVKKKKLKELRTTGLSEIYCSEVERKARACSL
ncbi:cilia- and flagella-associated protein 45-like [Epinephelus moara]|uniref:cilia- and flagella-associated protein 45-like n=1 Tax=Epinephelus moara TaxID=300413 RepID=UPI00214EC175|nr:cilia- and flagella-associated protein 45-like [Epinephelus moara]